MHKAILFIPDISGFTEFVKKTEVQHSKHIIKELLELLIDQNDIGLNLVEIEGDALFYYILVDGLNLEKLALQINAMYQAFHQHLQLYKYRRICNCGACTNAEGLKLKFIVHESIIEFIEIKTSRKPFGPGVIMAHRLLKNDVPINEYVLVSSGDTKNQGLELSSFFSSSAQRLESILDEDVHTYHYIALDQSAIKLNFNKELSAPVLGRHLLSSRIEINMKPNELFQFILDFEHRHLWNQGVDKIEYEAGEINKIGSKHTCVIGGNHLKLSTIYKGEKEGELVFIESTDDAPIVKNLSTVFKITSNNGGSLLEVDVFTKANSLISRWLTPILKYKLKKNQTASLIQLKEIASKD